MKIDVACGMAKKEGFVGMDISDIPGVDIVHDLNIYPWPIESNSVEEIYCSHYVEHVPELFKFFDELYRIMKTGAKAVLIAPYWNSMRAWQDPTHVNGISENTYLYCVKGWREANKLSHYPISCDFSFSCEFDIGAEWMLRAPEVREFAIKHYANVIENIKTTLTKL